MKIIKKIIFISILLLTAFVFRVYAIEFIIENNGEGSTNTISISSSQSQTIEQSNNANVQNNVEAAANSGGNNISGQAGGNASIQTGSSVTAVAINTTLNSNIASVCCGAQPTQPPSGPTPTPTQGYNPTPTPGNGGWRMTPTPTSKPSDGEGDGEEDGNGNGNGGGGVGGVSLGGKQVLGLAATHSDRYNAPIQLLGITCLGISSLLRKREKRI